MTLSNTMDALRDEVRRRVSILDVAKAHGLDLHKSGREWLGRCPFHDDKSPSLRVNPNKDGGVWRCDPCNVGGDAIRLVELLDRSSFPDALRRIAADHGIEIPKPREVAVYRYTDTSGAVLGIKRRWEPAHDGSGRRKSYVWEGPDGRRGQPKPWAPTLYRLPDVAAAIAEGRTVLVVEGEKCADALDAAGFVGTTNEDGAGKWKAEHAAHLRGAHVVVLPDADEPGRSHAATVLRSLRGVATSVRLIDLPGLPPKGDVADYLATHSAADLQALLDDAATTTSRQREPGDDDDRDEGEGEPVDAVWAAELERARTDLATIAIERRRAGPAGMTTGDDLVARYHAERDNPASRFWLVDGILPANALAILGAEPKVGKSWAWLEIGVAIVNGGLVFGEFQTRPSTGRVLGLALEDGAVSLGARLDALGRPAAGLHVEVRPHIDLASGDEDAAWLLASARRLGGVDLVVVDTLRDAHGAEENDATEMRNVMARCRALRDLTGATIILTHHMRRPSKADAGLRPAHRLRGSTAIHGSADAIVALELRGRERDEQGERTTLGVDVELRDGVGAGLFGLELIAEGIVGGRATTANWRFSRDVKGSDAHEIRTQQLSKKRANDAPASVLQALAQLGAADPCQYHAVDAIRAVTGSRKQATIDLLYGLAQDKQAERGLRGGWRLPVAATVPIVPNVPGNDRNDGNGGAFLTVPVVPTPLGGERGTVGTLGPAAPEVLEPNHAPTFPHMPKDRTMPTDLASPPAPTEAADQIDPPRTEIDVDDAPTWAVRAVEQADRDAELARLDALCGRAMGLYQ